MADQTTDHTDPLPEDVNQNPGARTAAIDSNPEISLEEARNANAGEGPTGSGGQAASTTEAHIPSSSEPFATDIPSANAPEPKAMNPDTNPNAASLNSEPGTGVSNRAPVEQDPSRKHQ